MRFEHATDLTKPAWGILPKGEHFWCRCGQTETPPFCDGHHQGTEFTPMKFISDGVNPMAVCACGLTKKPPLCDGSHEHY